MLKGKTQLRDKAIIRTSLVMTNILKLLDWKFKITMINLLS